MSNQRFHHSKPQTELFVHYHFGNFFRTLLRPSSRSFSRNNLIIFLLKRSRISRIFWKFLLGHSGDSLHDRFHERIRPFSCSNEAVFHGFFLEISSWTLWRQLPWSFSRKNWAIFLLKQIHISWTEDKQPLRFLSIWFDVILLESVGDDWQFSPGRTLMILLLFGFGLHHFISYRQQLLRITHETFLYRRLARVL